MSLYNMVLGANPRYEYFLDILGYEMNEIPRFRDCFLQDGMICLHTRTGGGNREEKEKENKKISPKLLIKKG